ncbi:PREDICTED: uncharacterized protein LOC104789687 [Camelina sativa]|uniref:Uncharacterized protein LOC104789687 n=1 Tax=Camelina sativa TaxID=90675 RepID=A0ABM0ZC71_CAMSA|nr:PREDICTED: uncharacterized protein LOC104789687 [Camelina sativa]
MWGRVEEALHTMLTDMSDEPALFCRDAPPVFNDGKGEGVDSALEDIQYKGDKLFVGRVFKNKADCKIKLAIHAINQKFHFMTSQSTPKFMVLKCISKTCPWRVYAVKVDTADHFQVRQANQKHTSTFCWHQERAPCCRDSKNPTISISYWKAWRAREVAMELSLGSIAGSYALLPAYIGLLQQTNPGSLCFTEHVDDPDGAMRFKYQFIAYGASVKGYKHIRKVVVIDAFAIVDSENDDAWEWFFRHLSAFILDTIELVFISDRHASIYTGLRKVYTEAHHAACTVHLWRNIRHLYKPQTLAGLKSAAARAYHVDEFNKKFLEIQRVNPGCAAYLVDIGFSHWTRVHSKEENFESAMSMAVRPISDFEFQVQISSGECFTINLVEGTCSCNEFQSLNIPCAHAVAAATPLGISIDTFVDVAYYEETIRHSYAERVYPIPSVSGKSSVGSTSGTRGDLNPPFARRPPERPKIIRILSRGEFKRPRRKSTRKCSRCCHTGHNKASCKNAI